MFTVKKKSIKRQFTHYTYALSDLGYNMRFLFGPANISNIQEDFRNRKTWKEIFPNNQMRIGKQLQNIFDDVLRIGPRVRPIFFHSGHEIGSEDMYVSSNKTPAVF